MRHRAEAARSVAERWRELGIPFLVVHGLDGYPEQIGRDLDILMDQRIADLALGEASKLLDGLGWPLLARPPDLWGKRLVALRPDGEEGFTYLELHTAGALEWMLLRFADHTEIPDLQLGPFSMSRWATFAKAVLMPLLAKNITKLGRSSVERLHEAGVTPEEVSPRVTGLFGRELGEELLAAYREPDPNRWTLVSPRLRRACAALVFRRPGALAGAPRFLARKAARLRSTTGVRARVGVVGEDVGKRLVEQVARRVQHVFLPIEISDRGGPWKRLRQQYYLLARQGLVLEPRMEGGVGVTVRATLPHGRRSSVFLIEVDRQPSWEIAEWIVKEWVADLAER